MSPLTSRPGGAPEFPDTNSTQRAARSGSGRSPSEAIGRLQAMPGKWPVAVFFSTQEMPRDAGPPEDHGGSGPSACYYPCMSKRMLPITTSVTQGVACNTRRASRRAAVPAGRGMSAGERAKLPCLLPHRGVWK